MNNISTDEWMQLMRHVVDRLDNRGTLDDFERGEDVHFFFWEKYCSLYNKVLNRLKTYEKYMFSSVNLDKNFSSIFLKDITSESSQIK